jgi:hypothetical protein
MKMLKCAICVGFAKVLTDRWDRRDTLDMIAKIQREMDDHVWELRVDIPRRKYNECGCDTPWIRQQSLEYFIARNKRILAELQEWSALTPSEQFWTWPPIHKYET